MEERMKRNVGVSLAALSTAVVVSTCPLLASTHAQAAVAPLDASYGLSANTINYAGPATGTLVIGGKTYKFKNGTCASINVSGITVDVTLGSTVQSKDGGVAKGNAEKPYFSIDLSPHPPDIINTAYYGGKELVDSGSITATGSVVKSGSSKGTFSSGTSLNGSTTTFTGSWNCHGKFEKH
jgi:hypothetical protein